MLGTPALIAVTLASNLLAGVALSLPLHLLPVLPGAKNGSKVRLDLLRAVFGLVLVSMMLVAGIFVDKWTPLSVLLFGSLALALAFWLLERATSPATIASALVGLATGAAALATSSLALSAEELMPNRQAAAIGLSGALFGAGWLLGVLLRARCEQPTSARRLLVVLAVACLTVATVAIACQTSAPEFQGNVSLVLADVRPWLVGLVLFFYFPLERAARSWIDPFLRGFGYRAGIITIQIVGFWVALLASRFGAGVAVKPSVNEAVWLVFISLGAAAALGNLVGATRWFSASVGLVVLAFLLGPLPTLAFSSLLQSFPANKGTAIGVALASGTAARFLFPSVADPGDVRHSTDKKLRLSLGICLAIMVPGLILAVYQGR